MASTVRVYNRGMTSVLRVVAFVTCFVTASSLLAAQNGPPPEIRAMIQGVVAAVNGDDAAWAAYEQQYFAPAFLKTRPADLHAQIVSQFGTITVDRVNRMGPDAPLELNVKGSKSSGTIVISINGDVAKILDLKIGGGGAPTRQVANGLPPIPVDKTMTPEEIDRRLDAYLSQLAKQDVFSGVALVAHNGTPALLRAYGYADREKKVANTIRTRFNIGSINKAFTGIAIRQLVADGKVSLTDTLGKFYPDYPQAVTRQATVAQLLNHRGGVADFFGPQFNSAPKSRFASNADYFTFVGSLRPLFAPGEREQYCNGCYIALGAIVEKASGMPYEKYMTEHVYGRAEMTSTGFPRTDQPAPDIALGYTRRADSPNLVSNIAMHGVTGSGAGGNYSTALDLLSFVKAVRAGKFPGTDADLGIAGGAPGTNAVLEAGREWTVIVLTNFDPPTGEDLGTAIARALR